jgi:hypothetical protein
LHSGKSNQVSTMSNVVKLGKAAPDKALEGLNRLTGLVFESWPESLVKAPVQQQEATAAAPASRAKQLTRRTGSH